MPCWTVTTAEVKLSEQTDAKLLQAALATLNITNYTFAKGQLTIQGRETSAQLTAQVKVAYSRQVVFSQAKRFGWTMQQTAENQWKVQRR